MICELDHDALPFRYCSVKGCTWTESTVVATVTEDQHGVLIAAGGWCQPSENMYDIAVNQKPAWYYEMCWLARKFEKAAKKLEKKERKLMPTYRSTAKIATLRANAKDLRDLADKLAEEFPIGSVNEAPRGFMASLPKIEVQNPLRNFPNFNEMVDAINQQGEPQ